MPSHAHETKQHQELGQEDPTGGDRSGVGWVSSFTALVAKALWLILSEMGSVEGVMNIYRNSEYFKEK